MQRGQLGVATRESASHDVELARSVIYTEIQSKEFADPMVLRDS